MTEEMKALKAEVVRMQGTVNEYARQNWLERVQIRALQSYIERMSLKMRRINAINDDPAIYNPEINELSSPDDGDGPEPWNFGGDDDPTAKDRRTEIDGLLSEVLKEPDPGPSVGKIIGVEEVLVGPKVSYERTPLAEVRWVRRHGELDVLQQLYEDGTGYRHWVNVPVWRTPA
jgi:hypothetical protein